MDDSDSEELECLRKYSNHSEVLLATVLLYIDSPMRMLFQELLIRIDKKLEQMERKQIHMEKRMEKIIGLLKLEQGSSQARPNSSDSMSIQPCSSRAVVKEEVERDNGNVGSTALFTKNVYYTNLLHVDCIVENSLRQPVYVWTQSPTQHVYPRGISRFAALQVKEKWMFKARIRSS